MRPLRTLLARSLCCLSLLCLTLPACGSDGGGGGDASDGGTTADGDGSLDTSLPSDPAIVINEVVSKGVPDAKINPTGSDWIELYNTTGAAVSLDGWRLLDSKSKTFDDALPLPPGLSVPAKGYLLVFFNKDGAGSPVIAKGLSASEAVSLFHKDGSLQDLVDWKDGDAPEGKSWGRTPDGGSAFITFDTPTPNAANP